MGALHPAQARHRRRPHRDARARGARRPVLHAAGAHRRRRAHRRSSCARSPRSPPTSPATPPTSPTGRTSSCTGSGSRTCPTIWQRLEAVGLHTAEACGDTPRVILGSPGRRRRPGRDRRRHGRRSRRSTERYIGDPEFSNLPRKFKTAISGSPRPRRRARGQRHVVRRRRPPRARPGFDVWVGGGLSTNPHLAQRLGVFVRRRDARGVGRRRRRSSATTGTGGCATRPG